MDKSVYWCPKCEKEIEDFDAFHNEWCCKKCKHLLSYYPDGEDSKHTYVKLGYNAIIDRKENPKERQDAYILTCPVVMGDHSHNPIRYFLDDGILKVALKEYGVMTINPNEPLKVIVGACHLPSELKQK